ncbi:MAG: SpoIIE family protein phosphatase [Spirochaetales bacterium]|nr:SpoIIE family protein phosphatase [Spirochaetales bacterium]
MLKEKILIVEDDNSFAQAVKKHLLAFGYEVVGIASRGKEAIEKAGVLFPDLVIMDVHLDGEMDGIEAAYQIMENYGIPAVYLAAHADQEVLDRAQHTEPLGYIDKPLQEESLRTTVELALYKAGKEKELKKNRSWLTAILQSIGEGAVVFSSNGDVVYCNTAAEEILDIRKHMIIGEKISKQVSILHRNTHVEVDLTSNNQIFETRKITGEDYVLKTGTREIPVDFSIIPVNMADPFFSGFILVLQDISERKKYSEALQREIDSTYEMQRGILPENDMILSDVRINCFLQPCTFGAGDLFSYFQINDEYAGFYMLDVMGHGIPATITSLMLHRLLSPYTEEGGILLGKDNKPLSPSAVLDELNKQFQHEKNNQYFTIIYGLYNLKTMVTRAAGGGHNFPILQKADSEIRIIRTEGSIVGFFLDLGLTEVEFSFEKGDRLFFYTDGLIECNNEKSERFSQERLISFIKKSRSLCLKDLVVSLEKDILRWRGKHQFDDDISFLALERE